MEQSMTQPRLRQPFRRGLTIPEVLASVAAVASLVALLQPAERFAKQANASPLACQMKQRSLTRATLMYALEHQGWLPGPNTSGADVQVGALDNTFDTTPTTPVESHDWMSPVVGDLLGLSANRAERQQQLLNGRLRCPEATAFNQAIFGSAPDLQEYVQRISGGGFAQVSYLSPASFHYFPNTEEATARRYLGRRLHTSFQTPVAINPEYLPRIDLLGVRPAEKIWVADGTRYLTGDGVLDINVSPRASIYGNSTSSGPTNDTSTAYGRRSASQGMQLPLTFRHDGSILTARFDGSVIPLTQTEAWTDAKPWYPSGSVYNGGGGTIESRDFHELGEVLY